MPDEELYPFDMKDTRTREERIYEHQLERLRYWLALPSWCLEEKTTDIRIYSEGVWLLAGIDPEETNWGEMRTQGVYWGFKFLPEGRESIGWKERPKDAFETSNLETCVWETLEHTNRIIKIGRDEPATIIAQALKSKMQIPWLKVASNDSVCSQYLPTMPSDKRSNKKMFPTQQSTDKSHADISSQGGKARINKKYPNRSAQLYEAYLAWGLWRDTKLYDGRKCHNKTDLAKKLLNKFNEENSFTPQTILSWFRNFKEGERPKPPTMNKVV